MTTFTQHAAARIRQRGLREKDVEFILRHGTHAGNGVILAARDVQRIVAEAKRTIDMAARLKNKRVIADGDEVITAFHADPKQAHELLHA